MIKNATYKPIIKSYPEYAHLFSILGNPQNDSDFSKWFCWNFIQLRYDSAKDVDEALFFEKDVEECNIYRCSLLDKMIFEKNMFKENILLKLKRKYRNKINFELPNINVEHVTSHDDLYQNVYRKSLSCGCGSEYLIVSQNGEIRPCQMLPEAWFSIKNKNAFWEHINGNFHTNELYLATKKYYTDNNFVESNISPCQALESLMNLEEKQYVSQK